MPCPFGGPQTNILSEYTELSEIFLSLVPYRRISYHSLRSDLAPPHSQTSLFENTGLCWPEKPLMGMSYGICNFHRHLNTVPWHNSAHADHRRCRTVHFKSSPCSDIYKLRKKKHRSQKSWSSVFFFLFSKRKELSLIIFLKRWGWTNYLVWAKSIWPSVCFTHCCMIYNRPNDENRQRRDATQELRVIKS